MKRFFDKKPLYVRDKMINKILLKLPWITATTRKTSKQKRRSELSPDDVQFEGVYERIAETIDDSQDQKVGEYDVSWPVTCQVSVQLKHQN